MTAGAGGPGFTLNVVAAVSMLLITPYTVWAVFPINDALLAAHAKVTGAKKEDSGLQDASVRRDLDAWKAGDVIRMNLARVAVVAGTLATLGVWN